MGSITEQSNLHKNMLPSQADGSSSCFSSGHSENHWSLPGAKSTYDPLLESLIAVARLHGRQISAQSLCAGLPLAGNRLTPNLFSRAASRANLDCKLVKRSLPELRPALLPAVVLLKNREACVLLEIISETQVRVQFPEQKQSSEVLALDELEGLYDGAIFFVRPKFEFDVRSPSHASLPSKHWFWGVVQQNWRLYRDALLSAFVVNVFALFLPLFSMTVYDRVIPNHAESTLWMLTLGVVVMMGFDILLRTMRAYIIDTAGKRIDNTLSARIMDRILNVKMSERPSSVGACASNIRAFESVRDFIASATITTLIDMPFAVVFLFALFWISPWFLLPVILCIAVILIVSIIAQKKMEELVDISSRANTQRQATLVESLVGVETIKTTNAQSQFQRKYEEATVHANLQSSKVKLISATSINLSQSLSQLVTVLVVITGVYLIFNKDVSQGGIIAASMIAGRAFAPFAQTAGLLMQFHSAKIGLASVEKHMQTETERPETHQFLHRESFDGQIEFKNVSFAYKEDTPLLKNVSFKIKPGEKVAIIGRIGSGKSSLMRLILGLQRPNAGTVLLDGVDIRQIDPSDLRAACGYVSQDVQLFHGTLKSNIALGNVFASDQMIAQAAHVAGLTDFVHTHPNGFDMEVGERGETLSGGQRQAVGLARALLNESPILLLDEPTSSMDHQSEAFIKKQLESYIPEKTLIVVTHRNSLLDWVDRLIVMDKGQIVADGPKEKIIQDLQNGRVGAAG